MGIPCGNVRHLDIQQANCMGVSPGGGVDMTLRCPSACQHLPNHLTAVTHTPQPMTHHPQPPHSHSAEVHAATLAIHEPCPVSFCRCARRNRSHAPCDTALSILRSRGGTPSESAGPARADDRPHRGYRPSTHTQRGPPAQTPLHRHAGVCAGRHSVPPHSHIRARDRPPPRTRQD